MIITLFWSLSWETLGQSFWKAFVHNNYLVLEPLLEGPSARAPGMHFLMIITLFWNLSWEVLGQSLWKAFPYDRYYVLESSWGNSWPEPLEEPLLMIITLFWTFSWGGVLWSKGFPGHCNSNLGRRSRSSA